MIFNLNHEEQLAIRNQETIDFFEQNNLFETLMKNKSFNNDKENYFISHLIDKALQTYQKNIKLSKVLNYAITKLEKTDFITEHEPNITSEIIWQGVGKTLGEFTQWLSKFVKQLTGFNKLNQDDLLTIISAAIFFCFGSHINCFFDKEYNECYMIISNNIQISKSRLLQIFSPDLVDPIFKFHSLFRDLNLTETEIALWYPLIICNCNPDVIKDKENFLKIKNIYTKCFLYTFDMNKRDTIFYQKLSDLFNVCAILDSKKEKLG